jgi:hypothetical protein
VARAQPPGAVLADPRAAVVMAVRLSTGALALTRHGFLQGEPDSHWSWMSVRGTKALAESVRAAGERSWSVRVRTEGWAAPEGHAREEERTPPPLTLAGEPVARGAEGTVRLLRAFRATVERGEPPLIPVRPAVAASLVGVAGAESLANGSRPVPVPALTTGAESYGSGSTRRPQPASTPPDGAARERCSAAEAEAGHKARRTS